MNPSSTQQQSVRGRLQQLAATWRSLTAEQRAGWDALGLQMTRQDSLGQTYTLTGAQAYLSVNANNLAAGNAAVDAAPALVTPDPMTIGVITLTAAANTVAYTPTPLAAGQRAFVYMSPQRSAGRSFEGDLRLVHVSAAAAASPANVAAAYTARFGLPVVGNRVFYALATYDTGFLSTPAAASQVVA